MQIFDPNAFAVAYNTLSRGTPVLNEAISLYGQLPRLKYEREQEEQRVAHQQKMDEERLRLQQEQFQMAVLDKHIENAMQMLKLVGPTGAMKYLDRYVPGHGISFEGYMPGGIARFRGPDGQATDVFEGLPFNEIFVNGQLSPKAIQLALTDKTFARRLRDLVPLFEIGLINPYGEQEQKTKEEQQPPTARELPLWAPPDYRRDVREPQTLNIPDGYITAPGASQPQAVPPPRPQGRDITPEFKAKRRSTL